MIQISDTIEYIKGDENPLSSDVIFIKGDSATWVFDVGNNDESFEAIKTAALEKPLNIIISHFHPDHMGNLSRVKVLDNVNFYVSKNTYNYSKIGNIVDEEMNVTDGVRLKIFKMPSSHAKGCLCVEINDEITLLGDAIYPGYNTRSTEIGKKEYSKEFKKYNVQFLKEQIDLLNNLKSDKVFMAHEKRPETKKLIIIKFLESIYHKREAGEPYICIF